MTMNPRSMRCSVFLAAMVALSIPDNRCTALRTKKKITPEGRARQFKRTETGYGVDISFPTHHMEVSTNYAWLPHNLDPKKNPIPDEYKGMPVQPLGDREAVYEHFMQGCYNHYHDEPEYCDHIHEERVETSLRQAESMRNFTETGFKKVRAPKELFEFLKKFWEDHKDEVEPEHESPYNNFWESPQHHLDVEREDLNFDVDATKDKIIENVIEIVEEWMGMKLYAVDHRGMRIYSDGAIVAPHVDDLPQVSTAIINIAQDVDEDWPLEIIDHDGDAYNVTLMPGDMVMYESHSTFHGRPFALKGRNFVNYFIHFESAGVDLKGEEIVPDHENSPIYVAGGAWIIDEEGAWWQVDDNYEGYTLTTNSLGATEAHKAAHFGDVETLAALADSEDREALLERDSNGWMPIHEAARGGHKEAVELLLENGADINERTNADGSGGSPLWWALKVHSEDHPVVQLLQSLGAIAIEPEL